MEQFLDQFLKPVRVTDVVHDMGPLFLSNRRFKTNRREYKVNGVPFSVYLTNVENPTILYIHTYNSNRFEVRTMLSSALKKGFNVVSIQVQRVGFSDDKRSSPTVDPKGIITFGYFEYHQIDVAMDWIHANINDDVIIWGRSMGAVCAVRYQHHYGKARELVLDSPFHNLMELFSQKMTDLTLIPTFIAKGIINLMKSTLSSKLNYNIDDLSIENEMSFQTSVTFLYNKEDMIANQSCQILYSKCKGRKQIFYLECPHEGERDSDILERICDELRKKHLDKEVFTLKKREFISSHIELGRKKTKPILYESAFLEEEGNLQEKVVKRPANPVERQRSVLEASCLF